MSKRKMPIEEAKELALSMIREDVGVHYKAVMVATGLSEGLVQTLRRAFTIRDTLGAGMYSKVAMKLRTTLLPVPEIAELLGISATSVKAVADAEGICPNWRRIEALKKTNRKPKPQRKQVAGSWSGESMSGDLMSLKWLTYHWGCNPGPRGSSYYHGRVW